MPIETHELERIKLAVAEALVSVAAEYGLDAAQNQSLGMDLLDAIDKAAADETDPRPFAGGTKVRVKGTGIQGVVVRTVEAAGELHTVVVRLALDEGDVQPETPFSPRELEVLS